MQIIYKNVQITYKSIKFSHELSKM